MNEKRSKLEQCSTYIRLSKSTMGPLRFRMYVVVVAIIILIFFLWTDMVKPNGYPPGPLWFPIVGSYCQFRYHLAHLGYHHLVWADLAQQYGPVTGLRLGFDRIIVVSGYDAVRDVLLRDEFDGRPDGFFFRHRTFGQRLGVVFTDGPLWMETRKFTLQGLGRLGKRNILAAHLETEAAKLVSALQKQCDSGPVYMHTAFDVSVLNTLWAFLAGKQFELNDSRLMELLDIVHTSFRMIDMSGGLLNQMPFLRFLAPKLSGYSDLVHILERLWAFLRVTIVEHRKSFNPGNNRDLIDLFLQKMENKDSKHLAYSELQLLSLCLDLFMAGSETTSNTLGFAVLYMLRHPEVQIRVQNEMDEVIGRDRQPTMEDRPKLNYVEAVLMEVQRVASIAPVAVAHRAVKDTILMGHTVPKGTTLLISIWSLHMDPKHWGDPEAFRPERFLDKQGRLIQDDWFIPFGFGKRRCLGEMLARHSLFMFFSTLLHNFSVSVPPGYSVPSLEGYDGVTLSPKPFPAKLTPRRIN